MANDLLERLRKKKEQEELVLSPLYKRIAEEDRIGCGCGVGWWKLLLQLNGDLSKIDPDYAIQQYKEKFGQLRFYATVSAGCLEKEKFFTAIEKAEEESQKLCELCGKEGTLDKSHIWWRCLCEDCKKPKNK
jgi:hypothetical protein